MTIIASEDSRNLHWSKNSIGSKLLLKMGWTEGTGLGRDRQGTAVALRAVRKHDSDAGIGATHNGADVTGNQTWNQTTDTFANVLMTLKSQHSSMSVNDKDDSDDGGSDDGSTKQQKKKKKKRKKLVLAQNKVNAGHSRKMREAKDLRNKSDADMAAIFGGVPNNNSNRTTKTKKRSRSEPVVDSSLTNTAVAELDSKSEQEAKTVDTTAGKVEVETTTGHKLKKDKKRSKRKESKSKSSSNDAEADNDQEKPKKKKRRKEAKEQVS